jgi:Uma2 family endonuclease
MQKPAFEPWTVAEFLAWERAQQERYEFVDGIVRMMVGGSVAHAIIKGNVYAALRQQFGDGACQPYVDGPKVVTSTAVMYPDVVVSCREPSPQDDTIPEPVLVVEVLSSSTESFDRGGKWRAYQEIDSLRYFVLIAQSECRVELYAKNAGAWSFTVLDRADGMLAMPGLKIRLSLRDVYRRAWGAHQASPTSS